MPELMTEAEEVVFYHSVGRLIDRWGYIDSLISHACKELIERLRRPASRKVPWGLMDRLAYVEEQFAQDPRLSSFDLDVKEMLGLVRQIDEYRGYLVHGCKTEFFRDPLAVQFTKIDRTTRKDSYEQLSMTVTFDMLAELAGASQVIIHGLSRVGKLLANLSSPF